MDAVGAAIVRDTEPASRTGKMMSLIVVLVWQYYFGGIVFVTYTGFEDCHPKSTQSRKILAHHALFQMWSD